MNEYSVTVLVDASRNYTVKAESPEAAVERAEELYSCESSRLCHHCSGKLDVGGAVGAIVYCEDKEVLDTSYQASRIVALEAECERLADALDRQSVITGDYIARCQGLAEERDALRQQRDKLAELLREAKSAYTTATHWTDMRATMAKIDAALSELTP